MKDNNSIGIRTVTLADLERVKEICIMTSFAPDDPRYREIIPLKWATPYIQNSSANCFVATDLGQGDLIVGYILCAPSTVQFESLCYQKYAGTMREALGRVLPEFPEEKRSALHELFFFPPPSLETNDKINKQHPAHLHIDILDAYQRGGLGHRLMDTLVAHLRENNIPGVHLWVGSTNEKGVSFYRKYGFSQVGEMSNALCFALSI